MKNEKSGIEWKINLILEEFFLFIYTTVWYYGENQGEGVLSSALL